ncbi:MAG: heavy metal sensor histidine kinase [Rubrivivax sp.]|nr:heavy metal sensor histidine kinase [Rubrivivax sp.]
MTWRHPSMAARLTVGLGLVALAVFSAAGAVLQAALRSELIEADRIRLSGKVAVALHFVDEATRTGDPAALFHHLDDLRIGHEGLHIWLLPEAGPPAYGAPAAGDASREPRLPSGVRADVAEAPLPSASPWPGGRVRVALESGAREKLLRSHLTTLVLICALGVASTVLLSWLAIRRCLRPVSRLSAQARGISPRAIGRRLTTPPDGAELTGLVEAFNHALDRLEDAYGHLQAFNANVAHELRTPLASLITGAQVGLSSPRTHEELRELLSSNLEELQLLNALVNDMLFLSRADRGDRAEGLERVALGVEADKAVRYCDAMLREAGVAAERVGDADANCNPPLVRRALVNLLTNAIAHAPAGERVRLHIEADGGLVAVSVLNPGPEIPSQVRVRMFERFYRVDASRSRGQGGHGLGLAIVAAIARMHGGSVFADRLDQSNRVGLTLPGADSELADVSPRPRSATATGPNARTSRLRGGATSSVDVPCAVPLESHALAPPGVEHCVSARVPPRPASG